MPLPTGPILGILADNLRKRRSVLPLTRSRATAWARGLGIPEGGETVLYTGHLYQLMPAIAALEKNMARLEDSWAGHLLAVGRLLNRAVNLSRFLTREERGLRRAYDAVLRSVARLLRAAGIEFGYLYGKELYTGALLYDQGVDDVFVEHAKRVHELLEVNGVRRVITVDPHTTNMLRSVYPRVVDGFDIEVRSYLEVLAAANPRPRTELDLDLAIHDSCVYARYEDVVEEPRRLLRGAGVRIREPEFAGKRTYCCGGPIESLYPGTARSISRFRLKQLESTGAPVVAMCPICLLNLKQASSGDGPAVKDISEYLLRAYCENGADDSGVESEGAS